MATVEICKHEIDDLIEKIGQLLAYNLIACRCGAVAWHSIDCTCQICRPPL